MFAVEELIQIGTRLKQCKYLYACLTEAMRLSPPIGGVLQREVLSGGLLMDEESFPEGITIGVPHYALHHNEVYFTDPFSFKPARWIDEVSAPGIGKSETDVLQAQSAFRAFGMGRTSCVGKALAYQEMSIVLARIVWLYDLRLAPGSTAGEGSPSLGKHRERKNKFQTWDGFFSTHERPVVQFRPRL